jgi:hypothetical protein
VVTVICDVIDTTGAVVQVFEFSTGPVEAADFVAKHPVKTGHPNPASTIH